ncbi:HupE/UreJ family protein [Mesorhizobium sp. Cs1299R1N3]|uniref:HupE/UreJ family protein n=1 Tax=Mesorhizobium sp. Cs1299R1N3 TaxID=3015173 RepID=UPI00301CAA96
MKKMLACCLSIAAIMTPSIASAHTGLADSVGFVHGFGHPFFGLDHVLTMTTVGVLAYKIGGRGLCLVPLAFVLAMAAGGALGIVGLGLPWVESGIALSVAVIGVLVALGVKTPAALAAAIVGVFAIFHGYAHGAEIPQSHSGTSFAAGFIAATVLLHLIGISLGSLLGKRSERGNGMLIRSMGGAVAVLGFGLLTGVI